MTVLVLSEDYDPSVDRVVRALGELAIPVFRADLGWFPQRLTVDAELDGNRWVGILRTPDREVRLAGLRSVWYRRPTAFSFPQRLPRARREHAEREARFGVGGVLASLPVTWMNHPQRDADHAYKPRQLALAARCGLQVPRTMVTNDAAAVRRFAGSVEHGMVIKALASNILYEDGQRKVGHTHKLTDDDLAELDGVELTAHQFQEWIPKSHEVRLIVVGEELFAVGIHTTDPAALIDWRADYDALTYSTSDVPAGVASGVRAFMTASGLNFSALDFVVTPDGRWVFLESNAGGQYGWLTSTLGTAVSDAIAGLLAQGDPQ